MATLHECLGIITCIAMIGASGMWFWIWWLVAQRQSRFVQRIEKLEYECHSLWEVVTKLNNIDLAAKTIWSDRQARYEHE